MRQIVIFGTGGMGREVHGLLEDLNCADEGGEYEMLGFLDGNPSLHGSLVHGLPVLGDAAWSRANPTVAVALAVGSPAARRRLAAELRDGGAALATLQA